jgi:hypothetical protein
MRDPERARPAPSIERVCSLPVGEVLAALGVRSERGLDPHAVAAEFDAHLGAGVEREAEGEAVRVSAADACITRPGDVRSGTPNRASRCP